LKTAKETQVTSEKCLQRRQAGDQQQEEKINKPLFTHPIRIVTEYKPSKSVIGHPQK